jgi:hypothetical protein
MFCLLAYAWAAFGIGDFALVRGVLHHHADARVILSPGAQGTLTVHHVGHRDAHEPFNLADNCCGASLLGEDEQHSDHVMQVDGMVQATPVAALALWSAVDALALAPGSANVAARRDVHASTYRRTQEYPRNSSLAFVKLSHLLI